MKLSACLAITIMLSIFLSSRTAAHYYPAGMNDSGIIDTNALAPSGLDVYKRASFRLYRNGYTNHTTNIKQYTLASDAKSDTEYPVTSYPDDVFLTTPAFPFFTAVSVPGSLLNPFMSWFLRLRWLSTQKAVI